MEPAYRLSRRKFLQAAMVAAAAAGSGITCAGGRSLWRFLSVDEARTLAAICDQIIPPDEHPGAAWAGVVNYVDLQLCGPLRHLRNSYREGIAAVDKSSRLLYGANFVNLAETKQVELLSLMEQGRAPNEAWRRNSSAELRRRHAHNRKRILIHLNNTAHHARIIVKMAVPIRVSEHDVRSAVRAMLIGGVEQTAKIRLKA